MHLRAAACRSEAHTLSSRWAIRFPPAEVLPGTWRPVRGDTQDPAVPGAPPARPPTPHPQVPGAVQALSSQGTEEAGKGRLGKSCAPRDPNVPPLARLCCNPLLRERRKRPAPTPRQRLAPGRELRRARAYSGKAPAGFGGGGGVPKLSHQPGSRFPGCSPGPFLPRRLRQLSRLRTPGGRQRRPGSESYLPGKFPAFGAVPTPGAGPQGAAGWALGGCGSCGSRAGLPQLPPRRQRSGPSPRLARPTPGPHWQRESPPLRVFRKAPSLCAPAGAAPPAPLPTGAAPALGPAGARHANFPPGAFAPPHPACSLREAKLSQRRLLP